MKITAKKILIIPLLAALVGLFYFGITAVSAADEFSVTNQIKNTAGAIGYNTAASTNLSAVITSSIQTALGYLGVAALIIIIAAGFMWMTAGGNEDKVNQAKKWMINGAIGLAIIIMAYSISYFVINVLINVSEEQSSAPLTSYVTLLTHC